jgi:hypothetical protein
MPILGGIRRDAKLVIQKLRASLRRIRRKSHSVETGQEQGHEVLSQPPVLKLPPELIGRVFLLQLASEEPTCCACGSDVGISGRVRAAKRVHRNMLVCKTWRAVIQGIPQLWSNVELDERVVAKRSKFEKKRFQLWKTNSGGAPLCVNIVMDTSSWLILIWNEMVRCERVRLSEVAISVRPPSHETLPLDAVESIWTDLEYAPQLISLNVNNLELQPLSFLRTPCLPSLRSLHILHTRPPAILAPSLRNLIVECKPWNFTWDCQKLLDTSPLLERIQLKGVHGMVVKGSTQSPDYDLRPFVQKNLEHFHIQIAGWDGMDQFCEALILTGSSASIKSMTLLDQSILSVLTLPVLPHSFSNLTSLSVSILSYKPSYMMGLVVWLKHAHQLTAITIVDSENPGFLELFLQTLLINPKLPSSSIVCPRLSSIRLFGHSMLLPSLFVHVISQREEHLKQAILSEAQSGPEAPSHLGGPILGLNLCTLVDSCHPRLGDATLKSPSAEGESGGVTKHEPSAEWMLKFLNKMMTGIGCGVFSVDSLAEIAIPEERFRVLQSLLDLPVGDS